MAAKASASAVPVRTASFRSWGASGRPGVPATAIGASASSAAVIVSFRPMDPSAVSDFRVTGRGPDAKPRLDAPPPAGIASARPLPAGARRQEVKSMTVFGRKPSEYVAFQRGFLIATAVVGVLRLALSVAGVSDSATRWISMTAIGVAATLYYGVAVHTRGFGSYKQLLPL